MPKIFLPIVSNKPNIISKEEELFQLISFHPLQQRSSLIPHSGLTATAEQRAQSLASLRYFAHCEPNGLCVNALARLNGCKLPESYPNRGNSIECLVAGTNNVAKAFLSLLESIKHRNHLLGLLDFFREQRHIGIAYLDAPGSVHSFYFVILISKIEE